MFGLFEKIRSLAGVSDRPRAAPFASAKTTLRWLRSLPDSSDYDTHHALVEGLERYNGDTRGDAVNRLKALKPIEEAGWPLQARLVGQYLNSHETNDSSRQNLWRECHLYWDQLTVAYLPFLNSLLTGNSASEKLSAFATQIAVKTLRYFALCMRWEYLRGRRPSESAWRRLHRIYRALESGGMVLDSVKVEGMESNCAREYVLTLLYDLANPYAFSPAEIHLALELLDNLRELPVPESGLRHGRHSHMVDLTATGGPEPIDDRWVPGGRLRYIDFHVVMDEFERCASRTSDPLRVAVCKKLSKVIERAGSSRRGPRNPRFGEMRAVFGMEEIVRVFSPLPGGVQGAEFITLRDESSKGIGFVLHAERELPPGSLLAVDREVERDAWQLLAARWQATEGGQFLLGTEVLSKYPKRVDIEWQGADSGKGSAVALFLPLASASQGATSNLLLPQAAYLNGRELLLRQDDGTRYRLKLGGIVETHEAWLRVGFDVLSREAGSRQ